MSDFPISSTGRELDPEDMRPVFGYIDGVPYSRTRWLEATKDERRAKFVEELKADANLARPPAKSAPKSEWVEYATREGVTDANDRTKDDLIALFGDVVDD